MLLDNAPMARMMDARLALVLPCCFVDDLMLFRNNEDSKLLE